MTCESIDYGVFVIELYEVMIRQAGYEQREETWRELAQWRAHSVGVEL
jgi:hypothetical protein